MQSMTELRTTYVRDDILDFRLIRFTLYPLAGTLKYLEYYYTIPYQAYQEYVLSMNKSTNIASNKVWAT